MQEPWLWRTFLELSTCRAIGMGIGPIPCMAIIAYVDRFGLPLWCVDAVMRIDQAWLEQVNSDG